MHGEILKKKEEGQRFNFCLSHDSNSTETTERFDLGEANDFELHRFTLGDHANVLPGTLGWKGTNQL